MKKKIDIEKLLQWAMRDELPKGRPVSDDIGRVIAGRFNRRAFSMSMGARPDIDTFGFVPGSPHEDAERVADAVASLATVATFDDESDARGLFGDLLPIAGGAASAIMFASFNPQSIVVSMATMGARPQWKFDQPKAYQRFVQFRDAAGALRRRPLVLGVDAAGDAVELKARRGRAAMRDGVYDYAMSPHSPLHWDNPSLIAIGHARAEYISWHGALLTLARRLAGRLNEFDVQAPAVAALPWITGETPVSRVLSDGFPAGLLTVPLRLAPKRSSGGKPIESPIQVEARRGEVNFRRARAAKNAAASA